MEFLEQVKGQLQKMSEVEKDEWIITQAQLLEERNRGNFLLSLSGEKKVIDMPSAREIEEFCRNAENGNIYFEYETHYYEFDDDGRYMDDWRVWHNDPFGAAHFLSRVFSGCHDLLVLGENQEAAAILSRILNLKFQVETAENSEDLSEEDTFSMVDADEEGLFSVSLGSAGEDWLRAESRLSNGQRGKNIAGKFLGILEHPSCREVKARILFEENVPQEIFIYMVELLEREIEILKSESDSWSREGYRKRLQRQRKEEILSDIRIKCIKNNSSAVDFASMTFMACWQSIIERIRWLSYERYIDDQLEIDEIYEICEAQLQSGRLGQESWENRRSVLKDIIKNDYFDKYGCSDIMEKLADQLCLNKSEYLELAGIMEKTSGYEEQAAYLYHQYGEDKKYVCYLEHQLGRRNREYSALITYYQEHGQQEEAKRIARLCLENCKEDLTDGFICLLLDAKQRGDQEQFRKLYASAKRRKHVDIVKVKAAVEFSA